MQTQNPLFYNVLSVTDDHVLPTVPEPGHPGAGRSLSAFLLSAAVVISLLSWLTVFIMVIASILTTIAT